MVEVLKKRLLNPFCLAAVIFALLIYSGLLCVTARHPFVSLVPSESVSFIEGQIVSNPVKTSSGKYYILTLAARQCGSIKGYSVKSSAGGNVKCLVPSEIVEAVYPGRLYSSFGKQIAAEKGEVLCVKGSFSNGVFFVKDADNLELEDSFSSKIIRLRTASRIKFKRLMFSWKNAGGFILALLSGSKEYTDKNVIDNFRRAGLSHILALSGMHLSFFAAIASGSGKKLFGKKFRFIFKFLGVMFFVWFAGLSPSLLRALLCSLIMLLCALVFSLDADFFIVLCSVFLIHCAVQPADIFSAAFILSYGALAGILLFADFFNGFICRCVPLKISSPLSASAGAQIVTAPVALKMFGFFTPWGIISTVVVSPLISMFFILSLAAIALCLLLPFLAPVFNYIMNAAYNLIAVTVQLFALLPAIEL